MFPSIIAIALFPRRSWILFELRFSVVILVPRVLSPCSALVLLLDGVDRGEVPGVVVREEFRGVVRGAVRPGVARGLVVRVLLKIDPLVLPMKLYKFTGRLPFTLRTDKFLGSSRPS